MALSRTRSTTEPTRPFIVDGETLHLSRRHRQMVRQLYKAMRRDSARKVTRYAAGRLAQTYDRRGP